MTQYINFDHTDIYSGSDAPAILNGVDIKPIGVSYNCMDRGTHTEQHARTICNQNGYNGYVITRSRIYFRNKPLLDLMTRAIQNSNNLPNRNIRLVVII